MRYIFKQNNNATKDSLTYKWYGKYMLQETLGDSMFPKTPPPLSNGEYISGEGGYYLNLYQLPKEIRIYSNLVSREQYPVKQDLNTDHRRMLWAHTIYFPIEKSSTAPPYDMRDGTRYTTFKGYSQAISYYHRDYSEAVLPDYRRTLYWNPDVETDHQGRFSLRFYNNARTKRIAVQAEGITAFGDLVTVRKGQ